MQYRGKYIFIGLLFAALFMGSVSSTSAEIEGLTPDLNADAAARRAIIDNAGNPNTIIGDGGTTYTTNPDGSVTRTPATTAAPGTENQPGATTDECKKPLSLAVEGNAWFYEGTEKFLEALGGLVVGLFINPALWLLSVIAFYMQQMIMFRVLGLDAVKILWTLLRDFVNLGFVFGMAVIAISTMLDIGKYTAQRTLLKLITAALLINFTLVFIGFFLDLNNIGSSALLYKMTQGQTLQAILYNGSGATAISQGTVKKTCGDAIEVASNTIGALADLTTKGIFLTIIVIIFLVIFLAFVIRIAHLVQLTILSPLIWTSYVFGMGTSETSWGGWWSNFFKWCFMPTIALFYIYLAFTVYATMVGGGGFIETSSGKDGTNAIFSMAINTAVLGALLSAAVRAAWESSGALASVLQGALAVASKSLVGQLGKMALGTIARTGLGKLAQTAGKGMVQKGIQRGGLIGRGYEKFGQTIQRAGEKTREPLKKETEKRIAAADKDTVKAKVDEFGKMDASQISKMSGEQRTEAEAWLKKHAEGGGKFGAGQTENIYKMLNHEKNSEEEKKENMEWFTKNAGQFDEKSLNSLISKGAAKNDVKTQMKVAAHLAKNKALENNTLEAIKLGNVDVNRTIKDKYKDEYKTITNTHIAYSQEVVDAGGIDTEEGAKAAALRVTNMNASERGAIDTNSLMQHKNGAEVVVLTGDALIPQVVRGDGAKDHLTKVRENLDRKAAAVGQTTQEYTKTNHKSLYNGIAKRSSHIGLIDSSNPMAEWKPEKKEKGQKKDTLSRIREGRETSRGQARPAQERGTLTADEERLHQEERQRRIGSSGGYRGPYIQGRPPATS